jgi:hypothetical protein
MARERLSTDEVDEIKEGDVLSWNGLTTSKNLPVIETDIIEEMPVPGREREVTAGVKVRGRKTERLISYETIADRYDVLRSWEDLSEEQEANI